MARMPDPIPAYSPELLAREGKSIARLERAALCDSARAVGPSAATLSGEWDVQHLLAHLVLRDNLVGTLTTPFSSISNRAVDSIAGRRSFEQLLDGVRSGPPRLSVFTWPGADRRFNALEFFVHHEDILRAQPGWSPRALPTWTEDKLWRGLGHMGKLTLRRSPTGITMRRSDPDEVADLVPGEPAVELHGLPSELVLYAYGRSDVARLEMAGDEDAVARLRSAQFSV